MAVGVYITVVIALCVLRVARRRKAHLGIGKQRYIYWMPSLAVAAITWPQIVRPLLDGDSLAYHLPNAAAWVHASSIWTTTTYYWWYPPASELFAAGLYLVAGPYSLGLAGAIALLFLGYRLAEWGAKSCNPWVASAISAATISIPALALQAGNLQNDVWLAAFFVETLWSFRNDRGSTFKSLAMLTLIKPIGLLYAIMAHAASLKYARTRTLLGYAPVVVWAIRDAILWRHPATSTQPWTSSMWPTTILGNGLHGLVVLAGALVHDGVWTVLLVGAAIVILPFVTMDRGLVAAAFAAFILYLLLPFAYQNNYPQLANGHSIRYLAQVLAFGAMPLCWLLRRAPAYVALIPAAVSAFNSLAVVDIFWNDATTHWVLLICGIVAAVLVLATLPYRVLRLALPVMLILILSKANGLAHSHPTGYYDDWISTPERRSTFFAWLSVAHLQRAVVLNMRSGAINVVSQKTLTIDALPQTPCEHARVNNADLIVGPDAPGELSRSCGRALYRDQLVTVISPKN